MTTSFFSSPAEPGANYSTVIDAHKPVQERGAGSLPAVGALPACFGVLCERHSRCARYHAVNGPSVHRIGTCDTTRTVWPLFVEIA